MRMASSSSGSAPSKHWRTVRANEGTSGPPYNRSSASARSRCTNRDVIRSVANIYYGVTNIITNLILIRILIIFIIT